MKSLQKLPILLVFLVMGMADAMGPLAEAVRSQYHLSQVLATLLPFTVFIAFAGFSVPGGLLAARIGKKRLLMLGLATCALGVGVPVLMTPGFGLLLGCIFLLGIGTTFLQVAANPLMRDVSPAGSYARNLALAQGVKGMGSSGSAWLVGAVSVIPLLAGLGWRGAFPFFLVLLLLALIVVAPLKVSEARLPQPPGLRASLGLLSEPTVVRAVVGIFLYVGAEVCLARFLPSTLQTLGWSGPLAAFLGPGLFFLAITAGRLTAGALGGNLRRWFQGSALVGTLGLGLLMTGTRGAAVPGVLLCGLGFANIWPMLFALTVEALPDRNAEISGLLCMAISGGALVPLAMGGLRDVGWNGASFLVPLIGFLYLLFLSLDNSRSAG